MPTQARSLHELLCEIELRLPPRVVACVGALTLTRPIAAIAIVYDDGTCAQGFAPHLAVWTTSSWTPTPSLSLSAASLLTADEPTRIPLDDQRLEDAINAAYASLLDSEELEELEDDEVLRPVREVLHRVARSLNQWDWRLVSPVADDLQVFTMDRNGYYLDEDLPASLSV